MGGITDVVVVRLPRRKWVRAWLVLPVAVLLVLALTGFALQMAHKGNSGKYSRHTLGSDRWYDLYVPASVSPEPQVWLVLHGKGSSPEKAEKNYAISRMADRHGFVVAYPAGTGVEGDRTWNAGTCCGMPVTHHVDDVAFLDRVVADVRMRVPTAQASGLRLVGGSSGEMMAIRYACVRPDQVYGVGGAMGAFVAPACSPNPAWKIYDAHGSRDSVVPFDGGYSELLHMTFEPVRSLAKHFPGASVRIREWDGGHTWPPFAGEEIYDYLR